MFSANILRTLAYASVFDSALTHHELWRFLPTNAVSYKEFSRSLETLSKAEKIEKAFGYVGLTKQEIARRLETNSVSQKKKKYAQKIAGFLSIIPWVSFVGLSGSAAINNADHADDIDLFIITRPQSLWISRLLCILLLELLNVRRRPHMEKVNNKICLNMFLDGSSLALESDQSMYLAREIAQVVPLVDKDGFFDLFKESNSWCQAYIPHVITVVTSKTVLTSFNSYIPKINRICFSFQLFLMNRSITTERVSLNHAFFFPGDRNLSVEKEYKSKITALGLN